MNLVILGGTGGLGRAVTLAGHRAGHTLTVMGRHAAGFAPPIVGVRMVLGDVRDAHDVERAIAGQDAVVWSVRAAPVKHGADAFEAGIPHLLAAMREHGVRRLVCVSCTVRARTARERFLRPRLRGAGDPGAPEAHHDLREAPVRDSGLDWTLVRPAALTNAHGTGRWRVATAQADLRGKRIARTDVAAFIVENLSAAAYLQQTVVLTD
jgi:putative NADH-flavin reductase